ncbi:hypothetical protein JXB27_01070 [Candidatus Woesearchaeota archaeon]|nr:hypothetical protein [Candidatus Woesearchaeota archaeon]
MSNQELAQILTEMADILDMENVDWKPRAYRTAAKSILTLKQDVSEIYKKGGLKALEDIPGVGEGIGKKIVQYIEKGKIDAYKELKKTIPKGLYNVMDIPGIGPKKAYFLYKKLNITSVQSLKKAVAQHKLKDLEGFGEASEDRIRRNLWTIKAHKKRFSFKEASEIANKIIAELKKLKEAEKIESAGSLRRKEETIGDIDILVISDNSAPIMDKFTSMPVVMKVAAKGKTKSEIILRNGMQADIRVVPKESFGSALQYFTGSKMHNIELRKIAKSKGYKLSEYGLFKGKQMIAGSNEEEIYNKLGLKWIPPEERRNEGEFEKYKI